MIDISQRINVIKSLLESDSGASLTYAALECRLTIEQVCYDRLRISYGYISCEDLAKWQPHQVVQQVVADANEMATSSFTFSISKNSVRSDEEPMTKKEFEAQEYVKVGEQIGLDLNKLGRLWQALSSVALHIKLPKGKSQEIQPYGDSTEIRKKIVSALREFEKLKSGSLIASGFGENYIFSCVACDTEIRRIGKLLRHNQVIYCVNPNCNESYQVYVNGDEIGHIQRVVSMSCDKCSGGVPVSLGPVDKLKKGDKLEAPCDLCGHKNIIQLIPAMIKSNEEANTNEKR